MSLHNNLFYYNKFSILENFLISLMQKYKVNMSGYTLIENYKIIETQTLSMTKNIEPTKNTIFQGCSFSKTLTAFAILHLASIGKIDIDSPINKTLKTWFLPLNKYSDLVTIRHCLSMVSGIIYENSVTSNFFYEKNASLPTLQEILEGKLPAKNGKVICNDIPGNKYHYCGAAFMVLQKVIEEVSEVSFEKFMEEKILIPLGMSISNFHQPLKNEKNLNLIKNESVSEKNSTELWENIPTLASGGLWTTPSEVAILLLEITKAYLGTDNKFISKDVANEMLKIQKNSIFGLGVVMDGARENINFRKNGHNKYYHNEFIMFPLLGKGVVVMTNAPDGINLINEFISFISNKFAWPSFSTNYDELNAMNLHPCKL